MFNLIVAHCRNRGIGIRNKLPWKIKADMDRFKTLTIGDGNNSVIMGRKTWESLPYKFRPLPRRSNIVVSSTLEEGDCKIVRSIHEAKQYCFDNNFDISWIIGGQQLYNQFLIDLKIIKI